MKGNYLKRCALSMVFFAIYVCLAFVLRWLLIDIGKIDPLDAVLLLAFFHIMWTGHLIMEKSWEEHLFGNSENKDTKNERENERL